MDKDKIVKKNKDAYNEIADTWAVERQWHIEKPSIDEALTYINPGSCVLDIGCGSGKPIAEYLVSKGHNVYGLDISSRLLEYARNIINSDHLFLGDVRNIKIDMTFDAIFCWWTMFHIHADEHEYVLKKICSLLNNKGILSVTFGDANYQPSEANVLKIDNKIIRGEQFGHMFYHSGHTKEDNT